MFGKVGFCLGGGFYVASQLMAWIFGGPTVLWAHFRSTASVAHLATVLLLLFQWKAVQHVPLARRALEAIDTVTMVVSGVMLAIMGATLPPEIRHINGIAAVCLSLSLRAIVIPSSMARTLSVSAAASLAAWITLAICVARGAGHGASSGSAASIYAPIVVAGMWFAGFTALATFASRVIYGLRQELKAARQIGQYTLSEKLGEGGMGVVYRATHAMLRRETAIKLLSPVRVGREALGRFEREVRMTARLTHPNTVSVYDFGSTPDGTFYYAMEYLDGLDLEALVAAVGALPPGRVVHLLAQVCASLTEAHEIGLIHRDVKPSNIMLTERGGVSDVVKVLDFGLAKDLAGRDEAAVTVDQSARGTPLYMSPEAIATPTEVGPASDLYAVAAVGYFLLTGSAVFRGQTLMAVCASHLHEQPEPMSRRLNGPIPEALERLVMKGLSKKAASRPASARELRASLLRLVEHEDVPRWTEEDAATWWSAMGRALTRKASAAGSSAPLATTIAVDVAGR
jgi:serine/threonine-protein kinase